MAEIRKEVKTFIVNKSCDNCNKGTMQMIKVNAIEEPMTYTHKCNVCGNEEKLDKTYPKVEYEFINEGEL